MAELSRRGFLGTLIGGVAMASAVRTWPFRVFSFPSEVVPVNMVRGRFAPLLAPGLRHIFLNYDALKNLGDKDDFDTESVKREIEYRKFECARTWVGV